ncbi:MAG: aminoacyl-histidine dipeptidase [Bacillus sp. (in: Bacteria)]|nr:aminoacyl-histidine dipeptidase [Bacillus sp. (in: firmicutes)]MCM1426432.1 aminoacyl-histidine dipeptidase [Eubacterium sp.]
MDNNVLAGIEPIPVFHFFEEICKIPHGSGNEKRISDYIKEFAKERGLFCLQDEWNNIIIVKEAARGYEEEETVILQGHMDMVAVKDETCDIDMQTQGLRLCRDGDFVSAKGSSLGGDDGIAVAYALALLDAKEIPHPRLEVILTVGEETGMDGARVIDVSMLKGRRMINLDNEEEGVLLTSCAGGVRADCILPVTWETGKGEEIQIQIKGLCGGHSGVEIHKERGNANCLMGRVLDALLQKVSFSLISLEGGLADNAIPRQASARIVVRSEDADASLSIVGEMERQIQKELAGKDDGVTISAVKEKKQNDRMSACLTKESTQKATAYIMAMPNGVQAMSVDVAGLVETSLNMGVMTLTKEALTLSYAIRSSVESAKEAVCQKLRAISYLAGGDVTMRGNYPGWAYRKNSPLRDKMIRIYEKMYGEKPRVEAIHAGLECGLFAGKLPELDCISCGPDMQNIHTTKETLSILSVKRMWEYLLEILRQK